MKRITIITLMLAGGLIATAAPVFAQDGAQPQAAQAPIQVEAPKTQTPNWFNGNVNMLLLGRDNVGSSKFEEYRVVPEGASMPVFSLSGKRGDKDFALFGQKIFQADQRYTGSANVEWLGVAFDYNQIHHNMGNDGQTLFNETAPGVWTMNATTRQVLSSAVEGVASTARTYPFYVNLLGPTLGSTAFADLSATRKRGDVALDLGRKLPFDLAFTYNRDVKTGYRGASGGDILGLVTSAVDVPEPLNEVTQDIGVRWAWSFQKKGDVHASFNRNLYNDRVDALIIDNPFRPTDTTANGPAQARFSTSPDNEASRGAFGAQFKFARQTRVTADLAFGQWTQNAAFLPYTINSMILTPAGLAANSVASLQRRSLNGKMNTASYNVTFASRPAEALTVRLRYRNYSYKDKTNRWAIAGDLSGAPDRTWGAGGAPTADEPFGHATANRTDASTGHFEGQLSYDLGDVTLEGGYRNVQTSWEGRVTSSGTDGKENGYTLAAIYHTRDWLGFRVNFDGAKRKVSGIETGTIAAIQGVMADHAERNRTRIGTEIELTPSDKYGVTFAYSRRNDDYPNRPFEVAGNSDTESGLLKASYDTYSVDFDFTPSVRAQLNAFYTYEKNTQTNQWVTMTSGALNNLLRYVPSDKGNTVGFNGVFHLVPEKWTFSLLAQHQKVDGLWDITAREAGAFYNPARIGLIPPGMGGAADVINFDDTKQTTAVADLGYTFAKDWTFSLGYAYEKFNFADAFSDGTTIFPQSVLFYMKANDGNYTANMVFTRLLYRF